MATSELHTSTLVSELRDRLRISTASNAMHAHRHNGLARWWSHSIARKLAEEIGSFPRRILAIRQLPSWGLYRLPLTPPGLPPNRFLQSCSECIQALRREFRWAGYLDAEIAARAYAEGARWAIDNSCTEIRRES